MMQEGRRLLKGERPQQVRGWVATILMSPYTGSRKACT
jgi:hypothetical protein